MGGAVGADRAEPANPGGKLALSRSPCIVFLIIYCLLYLVYRKLALEIATLNKRGAAAAVLEEAA